MKAILSIVKPDREFGIGISLVVTFYAILLLTFAREQECEFMHIEVKDKVMGLGQQDRKNELFNIITLIAKKAIYKCRLKATPPNRFIFEKYLIDQRSSEEILVSSEDEMEFFRSRWAKLDFVP